jgi:hypothetical protein
VSDFKETQIFGQIFENYQNTHTNFYENNFNGNNVFLEGRQMDRHDEANSHFSQF